MSIKVGVQIGKGTGLLEKNVAKTCAKWRFNACQIFLYSPMQVKKMLYDEAALRDVTRNIRVYVHSSYLISPWGAKPYNMALSRAQLQAAENIGAVGVVFHLPKSKPKDVVPRFQALLAKKPRRVRIILEPRAMQPSEGSYESPEKINALIDAIKSAGTATRDINICIDTAHAFCGQQQFRTYSEARMWLRRFKYPRCIKLFHLNGSQSTGFADRHAIAMSKKDKIWHGIPYRESGARAFVEFARRYRIDIVLECDFVNETRSAMSFINFVREP